MRVDLWSVSGGEWMTHCRGRWCRMSGGRWQSLSSFPGVRLSRAEGWRDRRGRGPGGVFTAIVYVLIHRLAWRHLAPSSGASVPTAHGGSSRLTLGCFADLEAVPDCRCAWYSPA